MTKLSTPFVWPEPIPDWDLMKWKDEIQLEIYEKTKDMTSAEVLDYFHQAAERADRRRAEFAERQAAAVEK